MSGTQDLLQMTFATPEGGDGILVEKSMAPNSVAVSGATRLTASNSVPADVIVFDAADESVIMAIPISIDWDNSPFKLRVGLRAHLESGTSVSVNVDTISVARVGLAGPPTAISFSATTAVLLDTADETKEIEFDLDSIIDGLTDQVEPGDTLYVELDAEAVVSSGLAHIHSIFYKHASMIVGRLQPSRA